MGKKCAVIKYIYVNHREYEDNIAGNQKHFAVLQICTNPLIISEGKGTTYARDGEPLTRGSRRDPLVEIK